MPATASVPYLVHRRETGHSPPAVRSADRLPEWITNNRNRFERLWAILKEWRAVATRYEKTPTSFTGVLFLAATLEGLSDDPTG